ncbi:MAG: single-stranded-DNA-specific exonuclease RecJ [Chloroflexi bacterium]|nr:single-stranded-DNA-specific exonuclease RecJ [Chloroflexota bacterium]
MLRTISPEQPLLGQLLFNRGVRDAATADRFLAARTLPLADPWLLADMRPAVDRLERAIRRGETIAIYGDYDADGLTATTVLVHALNRLGAHFLPFIPHRVRDGYGLQQEPLRRLRTAGASLVITVDCGVTANAEIEAASNWGLDVVVTDHHLVPNELPPAVAVVNPKRPDDAYPFKHLAGVGVAFRLATALLHRLLPGEADEFLADLYDLVAVGTIADIMPLEGENRTLVQLGLDRLNGQPRPGIAALIRVAGLEQRQVEAEQIAFALAPRLNAAGRIHHAQLALDLLLSSNAGQATPLAEELQRLNRQRQEETDRAFDQARRSLAARRLGAGIVVAGPFHLGIVGLVASRLVEELSRPVVVLAIDGDVARGSARSIEGVNVVEALSASAALMTRFGGHAMAAGCTLPVQHVEALTERFSDAVEAQRGEFFEQPALELDAELRPSTARDVATLDILADLEPCGAANSTPLFLTRDVRLTDCRPVGSGKHLKLGFSTAEGPLDGIAWRTASPPCALGEDLDVVYHLHRNAWNGRVSCQLEVVDWAPSGARS